MANRNEDEEEDMHARVQGKQGKRVRVQLKTKNKQQKETEECCIHLQPLTFPWKVFFKELSDCVILSVYYRNEKRYLS